MKLQLCDLCGKRPAVVYVNKIENNTMKTEALCIPCAKTLGLNPLGGIAKKMGLTEDDLTAMEEQFEQMIGENGEMDLSELMNGVVPDGVDTDEEGTKAPALDIRKILPIQQTTHQPAPATEEAGEKDKKKPAKEDTKAKKERKFLTGFCIDLTARAREGKLDQVIGREHELARLVQILCRRGKNNPCLIGEPGVGKTAIAEMLAQRIADQSLPQKLLSKEVFVLDMTALVAGTQFRGQFENRIRGLIEEIKKQGNIILMIDEIHTIVGAGDAEGGMNAANILKPALSRGDIQVIGATTLSEYRKYIEKDAALERRFQPIIVKEPSIEDTVEMLKGIKGYYEAHHGITIPDSVLKTAAVLSERYITDRFLPDKAIDLLDEACARVVLNNPVINRLDGLMVLLQNLKIERESLEAITSPTEDTYRRMAEIRVQESKHLGEFEGLSRQRDQIVLTCEAMAEVIEIWTGVPAGAVKESDFERISQLEEALKKNIVGQDEALSAICRAIKRSRAGVTSKRKPVSFLFAGPTGVGKTELVRRLANELFNSPEALIRLDMSEFMEKHAVSRIIGAPPGYVGYDEAGQLTEKIRRKPYSVVLFDEIEKAHPDVLHILLRILDDGRITDAGGREVNFENTVIVMTTNAGSQVSSTSGFTASSSILDHEKTKKALAEFLRPEFINRVDQIITFNRLSREAFERIAVIQLGELATALSEKDILLRWEKEVPSFLADHSFSEKFGARNLRRYIQTAIEDPLAEELIASKVPVSTALLSVKDGNMQVVLNG